MKTCAMCKKRKPAAQFHAQSRNPDGVRSHCKECRSSHERITPYSRRAARLRIYGLTPERYDEMLEAQGGVCAICERPPTNNRNLAVDHDHDTGAVRGLLCVNCNQALGMLQDSPDVLAAAAMYLLRSADVLQAVDRG